MTWLLENPLPILLIGLATTVVLMVVWYQVQKRALLLAIGATIALTALGLVVERAVVTPWEEVEQTLQELADALKANDLERTLSYVSPEAVETRKRAKWAMGRFRVKKAKVSDLKIQFNPLMSPPMAKATFTGIIAVEDKGGAFNLARPYPIRFTAEFRKQGERWVLTGHSEKTLIGNGQL